MNVTFYVFNVFYSCLNVFYIYDNWVRVNDTVSEILRLLVVAMRKCPKGTSGEGRGWT